MTQTPHRAAFGGAARRAAALMAVEPATRDLMAVWLAEDQWQVLELETEGPPMAVPPQVLVIEVPFPRSEAPPALHALARRYPGVPIVVISPTIVAGTPARGDVARQLGVAAVLPMPLSRAALLGTVHELAGLR